MDSSDNTAPPEVLLTIMDVMETKVCNQCKIEKPLETNFSRDSSLKSGYRGRCNQCRYEAGVAYKRRKREEAEALAAKLEEERLQAERRQVANRNAMLRLVKNHRAEFESYVNAELLKMRMLHTGDTPEKAWLALAT